MINKLKFLELTSINLEKLKKLNLMKQSMTGSQRFLSAMQQQWQKTSWYYNIQK